MVYAQEFRADICDDKLSAVRITCNIVYTDDVLQ